jgi:hypothetical protein
MNRKTTVPAALGVLALAGTCLAAGPAQSAPAAPAAPRTVTSGLLSPLSLAVASDGTRYFSQNFAGILHRQVPGKKPTIVYRSKGGAEVGGVSERNGTIRFAVTKSDGKTYLATLGTKGRARVVANLSAFEKRVNPDRGVTYGFRGLDSSCAAQFPAEQPATYRGIVESHPYATAQVAGTTYVADAAGNSILAVRKGKVRAVAVLPPAPLKVTAGFAEQAQLPACAIGKTAWFEGVPTDVEVGPNGMLYVSSLPGGPEDGSLGAGASVYRIDPRTGKVVKIAGGLVSATGLAVSPRGGVYVAELFRGRVAGIAPGSHTVRTFANAALPGDVEWTPRGIFATTNVLTGLSGQPGDVPRGAVVRFVPKRG